MSGSLNKVQLIGRLGRDPEARNLHGGGRVVNLRIATSESWRGSDGERRERTEWHQVSIWNEGLGDIVEKYLRKGALVYVEGKLHTSKWTDSNGVERWSTEIRLTAYSGTITFLESRRDNRDGEPTETEGVTTRERKPVGAGADLDDDIPF